MSSNLRNAETPRPTDISNWMGRDLVLASHLQNTAALQVEKLGDHLFVDERLESGDGRLGEGGL